MNNDISLSNATIELRQRFVNALRNEDAMTALRAYKCSLEGLVLWKKEEEAEKLRIHEEQIRAQQESEWKINDDRVKLKKLGNLFKSERDEHSVETRVLSNRTRFKSSQSILSKSSLKCRCPKLFKKQNQVKAPIFVAVTQQGIEEQKEEIHTHNDNSFYENGEGILGEKLHPSSSFNLYEDEFNARHSKIRDRNTKNFRTSNVKTKKTANASGVPPSLYSFVGELKFKQRQFKATSS